MSGSVISGEKSLALVSDRVHLKLTEEVDKETDYGLSPVTAYDLASGEIYVRFNESVRGANVFALQSYTGDTNKWITEQLIMIGATRRAPAKCITAVTPFYPYSRQGRKHQGHEPTSARLITDPYKTADADRVTSVDLHVSQEQGFFDDPIDHLFVMPVFVEYVRSRIDLPNTVMVSPDAGRIRVAERRSPKPGGCPLVLVHKTRDTTRPNAAVVNRVVGEVKGKDCIPADDMIDTAGTVIEAVKVLTKAGVRKVIIMATHGILSAPVTNCLSECGVDEVVVVDTLLAPVDKRFPILTILSIAPLLARVIREVFDDGSVTSFFD